MNLYTKFAAGYVFMYPGIAGPGNEWYVSSVIDAANAVATTGKSWDEAFGTIDEAINVSTSGDTIIVAADHTEIITGGTDIELDEAGVAIIGVVRGRQMPTITISHTTSTIAMSGAGCTLQNIRVLSGINAIVATVTVSAADCAIINYEFRETSTYEAVDAIVTTTAADRLLIDGCRHIGSSATGANTAIALVGADDTRIRNFEIYGAFALGAIQCRGTLSARVWIHSGYIWTAHNNDLAIKDLVTNSTGAVGPDLTIMLAQNANNITEAVTAPTFHMFNPVRVCNLVNERNLHLEAPTDYSTPAGYWSMSTDA